MPLLITLLLGFFFICGMFVIRFAPHKEFIEHISYALAFGALIAIIAFDVVPEILEIYTPSSYWKAALLTAAGIGLLKFIDLFIPEHGEANADNPVHVGVVATTAIVIHNIIEGMTVCEECIKDLSGGLVLAIGVGIHNIPLGMLIYSALHQEKRVKKYALMFFAAISTFIGGCVMMLLSSIANELLSEALMCLALGMIIFITFFELLPLLIKERFKISNLIGAAAGFAIVLLGTLVE